MQENTIDNNAQEKKFKSPLCFNYGDYTKSIYDFSRNLDYSLETAEERVAYLNDMLYKNGELEEYFVDLFAQVPTGNLVEEPSKTPFNVCLNKNDPLCGSTNASKEIERMADYILRADELRRGEFPVRTEPDLLSAYGRHNVSLDAMMESDMYQDIESELASKAKQTNYKKECKQHIVPKDFEDHTFDVEVRYYRITENGEVEIKTEVENILKQYDNLKKADFTCSGGKKRVIVSGLLKDQIDIKNSFKGCVRFKHVDKDSTEVDWSLVDYGDEKQLKYLLQLRGDLTTDVGVIQYDMDKLCEQVGFTGLDLELLNDYRDNELDVSKWADRLKMTENGVYQRRNALITRIANQYKDNVEDWYYLNVEKGQYKRCSKCGKILLISKFGFDAHKSDGRCSACRKCRAIAQKAKNDE